MFFFYFRFYICTRHGTKNPNFEEHLPIEEVFLLGWLIN